MQIDFHHATTYIVARDAGFGHEDADVIAYAAQYVDDATNSGVVHFDNGALYRRTSSAHKMLDIRNAEDVANHCVWMPFHFLPGNGMLPADQNPAGTFIDKIICRPNSPVAREMVRDAILAKDRAYGLHLLGITMHVYADTWAHQGFAGVLHKVNEVEDAEETGDSGVFSGIFSRILERFLDDSVPPLGHGRAQDFPDMPFLQWKYQDGRGKLIERDNTRDFLEAAEHMCIAMRRYIAGNPDAEVDGLRPDTRAQIENMFRKVTIRKGEERHEEWLAAIRNGEFTAFGKANIVDYFSRGPGSWKADALETSDELSTYAYRNAFLQSRWKHFHDALQAHRFNMIYNILPKYGICAA